MTDQPAEHPLPRDDPETWAPLETFSEADEAVAAMRALVLRDLDIAAKARIMPWLLSLDSTILDTALIAVTGPLPERMPSDAPWVPFTDQAGLTLGGDGRAIASYDAEGLPIPWLPADECAGRMMQADWERRRRHLKTTLYWQGVCLRVSTVILPFDARWDSERPPLLWETKIFTSSRGRAEVVLGGGMLRYASWAAATHAHALIVAAVKQLRARNSLTVRARPASRGMRALGAPKPVRRQGRRQACFA